MAVTNYLSINGQIHGEYDSGGNEVVYQADALGSVVTTLDGSGALANTYRFKPYGALLAKTGPDPDPKYLWTGTTPSRVTGRSYSDQYNRARHYGSKQAQWSTVDPLWPIVSAYVYCRSNSVLFTDPDGLLQRKEFKEFEALYHHTTGIEFFLSGSPIQTCCYPNRIRVDAYEYYYYITPQDAQKCSSCARGFASIRAWCKAIDSFAQNRPPHPGLQGLRCIKNNLDSLTKEADKLCGKRKDKCKHCYVTCSLVSLCGPKAAEYAGWFKEMRDLSDCDPESLFDPDDLDANKTGFGLSPRCSECKNRYP